MLRLLVTTADFRGAISCATASVLRADVINIPIARGGLPAHIVRDLAAFAFFVSGRRRSSINDVHHPDGSHAPATSHPFQLAAFASSDQIRGGWSGR